MEAPLPGARAGSLISVLRKYQRDCSKFCRRNFAVAAESNTRVVSFESQANQAGWAKQGWHGREQGNGGTHGDLGISPPDAKQTGAVGLTGAGGFFVATLRRFRFDPCARLLYHQFSLDPAAFTNTSVVGPVSSCCCVVGPKGHAKQRAFAVGSFGRSRQRGRRGRLGRPFIRLSGNRFLLPNDIFLCFGGSSRFGGLLV